MKKSIPFFAVLVILLSAERGFSIEFSQELGIRGGFVLSKADGFEAKSQGASIAELSATFSGELIGVSLAAGYHSVDPSNLHGGYAYRGFDGFHGYASVEWYPLGGPDDAGGGPGPFPRPGVSFGLGGFFSKYEYTDLLFFYPALRACLFSDFFFDGSPFRIRFALPAEVYLRKDLASSFSLSFGAWGVLSWSRLAARIADAGRGASR